MQSLVRVLTEALAKYQGELRLRAEVEEILVERNKAEFCGCLTPDLLRDSDVDRHFLGLDHFFGGKGKFGYFLSSWT